MASTKTSFSGLTDSQVLQVLRQIATSVNLMAEMCRERAEAFGDQDVALTFHALDTMLLGVGALADMPTGGDTVGDFAAWMVGPLFWREQRAAKAKAKGGAV